MPVSVAVCETTNVVNAALRESLGVPVSSSSSSSASSVSVSASSSVAEEAKNGKEEANSLQGHIVANAKRILMAKIEYEEVPNYQDSVLESLKSKYIVIKPAAGNCNGSNNSNGNSNGNNSFGKAMGHDNNGNAAGRKLAEHPNNNQNQNGHPHAGPHNNKTTGPNELPKPKKVLYPRENIRIGWKQSERKWQVGSGLINVGNTCYLNSTLQALFHIPALANWLVSEQAHTENCTVAESGSFCIVCAMAKTLLNAQNNQAAVRPFLIYSKLKQICKHMVVGRQEDAHEFLRFLVEAMERAYLMRFRNYKELDQLVKETTPLGQIFGGYLRSEVRCLSCSHVSITFQHFQDLLLDIRKSDSLEEAFEGYFSREKLEDFGYKCEGCKKKVSATKQFRLERAPITLCIQLKRFSMIGNKLTKQITIKPRIDLSKFAARSPAASAQPLTYRLVSMVTHLGVSQHCGHYTAIGSTESGSYYNFDDSYVRPIAMQSVCNTNAYIMFYELDLPHASSPAAAKANGLRLTNGHGHGHGPLAVSVPATVSSPAPSPARFIGPQLPPGGINGYSNGHAPKTTIQYKQHQNQLQQQHQPHQQNGLQLGTGKFQESAKSPLVGAHAKGEAAAAPNANGNKSSSTSSSSSGSSNSNHNHKSVNQQHYLPISSEEEDNSEDEIKTRPTVQLPSMPKMDDSVENSKPARTQVRTHVKTPLRSLVPYESASEEEEVTLPNPTPPSSRKRSSNSSDSEGESSGKVNGHSKTNGGLYNGSKSSEHAENVKYVVSDEIDKIFQSLQRCRSKPESPGSEDDDDGDDDEPSTQLTNGWHPQKQSQLQGRGPPSPKTPPSPAVIKSKTGIWKVTRNEDDEDDEDDDDDDDDDDEEDEKATMAATTAKTHRNPFASSKSPTDSPTTPGAKRQKLINGSAIKTQPQQPRMGNGYQSEANANGGTVNELLKQSHRGYGSAVLSWTGKPAELEKELLADAREQQQRDLDDDEENDMDRGRQRKVKSGAAKASNSTPGYNPFQEYEGQKRWNKNGSGGGGGGGGFSRFYQNQNQSQNFRQNFQQRNKFKFNRFGGPGSAKFQHQRALQRHLAAGGGFTRRQPTHAAQQQQQQS